MTAQINILKLDGNPGTSEPSLRCARRSSTRSWRNAGHQPPQPRAKAVVGRVCTKGMSDEALGDISARARAALDEKLDRAAEAYVGGLDQCR